MNFVFEKRKTRINFNRLRVDSRFKNGVLNKIIKNFTEKKYNIDNRVNIKYNTAKIRKKSVLLKRSRMKTFVDLKLFKFSEVVRSDIKTHEYLKTTHDSS